MMLMEFTQNKYEVFIFIYAAILLPVFIGICLDFFRETLKKLTTKKQNKQKATAAPTFASPTPSNSKISLDLQKLALEIWRIETRINKLGAISDFHKNGFTNSFRKIHSALEEEEIVILDYTGQPYFDGMNVDVIAFEESGDIENEIIKETLEPGILVQGNLSKRGKIIVLKKG